MHSEEKGETEMVQLQAVSKGHNICWKEIFQKKVTIGPVLFLKELCKKKKNGTKTLQLYILNFQLTLLKGIVTSTSFRLIPVVYHIPVNKEPCCTACIT